MDEQQVYRSETDQYVIERTLASGGMGTTHLVRSQSSGKQYVLKELKLERVDDWKALELFQREAQALRALDHPSIPAYVDVIVDQSTGTEAIVQTFVDGTTLQARINDEGPISSADLERWLRDALDILAYLQDQVPPVIHRDITPGNIMIDGNGKLFLIDFGAVKWSLAESTNVTGVGTFGYMSPEQILGRPTPASDIYSLGMTFAALASRAAPEDFPTDPKTGQVNVRSMLPVHEPVRSVLVAMTRPGVGERLTSARQAIEQLDRKMLPAPAAAPLVAQKVAAVAVPTPTKLVLVALLALIGIGAVSVFLTLRSQPEPFEEQTAATAPAPAPAHTESPKELAPPPTPPAAPPPRPPAPTPRSDAPPKPTPPTVAEVPSPSVAGGAMLEITSNPEGARVRVANRDVCATPCKFKASYGKINFTVSHGDKVVRRSLNLLQDQSIFIDLE